MRFPLFRPILIWPGIPPPTRRPDVTRLKQGGLRNVSPPYRWRWPPRIHWHLQNWSATCSISRAHQNPHGQLARCGRQTTIKRGRGNHVQLPVGRHAAAVSHQCPCCALHDVVGAASPRRRQVRQHGPRIRRTSRSLRAIAEYQKACSGSARHVPLQIPRLSLTLAPACVVAHCRAHARRAIVCDAGVSEARGIRLEKCSGGRARSGGRAAACSCLMRVRPLSRGRST